MLETLYTFYYEWLFGSVVPSFISAQGVEFVCIIFSAVTLGALLWLAILPFRTLFSWIFRG
jgi:hypothetical protein